MRDVDLGGIIIGLVFIFVGAGLLLSNLVGFNFWSLLITYWPVIFIIIGGSILIKHMRKH